MSCPKRCLGISGLALRVNCCTPSGSCLYRCRTWPARSAASSTRPGAAGDDIRRSQSDCSRSLNAEELEGFYRDQLSRRVHRTQFRPFVSLTRLDPNVTQSKLPGHLQRDPLLSLQDKTASLGTVADCLEAHVVNQLGNTHPDELRELCGNTKMGSRALHWFLDSESYNDPGNVVHVPRFFRAVAYSMVAGNTEQYLLDLALLDQVPDRNGRMLSLSTLAYRTSALRNLVEAQAFWSRQDDRLAESVATFTKIIATARRRKVYVPLSPVGHWLCMAVSSEAGRTFSPQTVDDFITTCPVWLPDVMYLKSITGTLKLRHPTQPDASDAFEYFRAAAEHPDPSSVVAFDKIVPRERRKAWDLCWTLVEVAQLLERQGRPRDARWILDFGRTRFPEFFGPGRESWRRAFDHLGNGLAFQSRRRRATETEIRRGLPVDNDGFRIYSSALLDKYKSIA